ncbi:MAG: glycosyltransferase family 4 protein [bacterium]|jgi:glycosyltransferase involved in cell wall biosynthesis|nr:glycosyltransferase family 4 protein [candidate division KSB1 bacterium]MDH7558806.1 glycosyltransferase family 4 protein [bacterium]
MESVFTISEGELRKLRQDDRQLDLAVVHLTFEGIQIFGGGVCTVTRGHLEALGRLQDKLRRRAIRVTPYFLEIAYAPDHPRRDRRYEEYARQKAAAMGGEVAYLTNYSVGDEPFTKWGVKDLGPVENWKHACASGAALALNFARRHQAAVLYCHDCVYALASLYAALEAEAYGTDIRAVYVVHSTALTHELPLPNPDRLMAEAVAMHWPKVSPRVRIGYISEFIRGHLISDYGVRPEHTVPTGNGLNPDDPHFRLRSEQEIVAKLREHHIPLDKPLMVTWGRAVLYKRFDVVMKVAAELRDAVHAVVVVSPRSQELLQLKEDLHLDMSLIFAFDAELIACLLQWKNTVAVPILAYLEPCGLTPMEARMQARRQGPLVITSDTGGLPEQIEHGVDGFITRQDDVAHVAETVRRIMAMTDAERERVRRAGLERILRQYTWRSQILTTLAALSPHVRLVAEEVRNECVTEELRALQ